MTSSDTHPTVHSGSDKQPAEAVERAAESFADHFRLGEKIFEDSVISAYKGVELASKQAVFIETPRANTPSVFDAYASGVRDAMSLEHENILTPFASFRDGQGRPFLLKSFAGLIRLQDVVNVSGPIGQYTELVEALVQICHGLGYAHERGIIHGALHPRDIYLGEIGEDKFVVKIDNFEQSRLRQQSSTIGVLIESSPELDVSHLGIVAYYAASGAFPVGMESCEKAVDRLSTSKSFADLTRIRPDLYCVEEYIQLLEDSNHPDPQQAIASVGEFENGLLDWMEAVASSRVGNLAESPVEKSARRSEKKTDTPTTRDLSSAVRDMVILRNKQIEQEASVVMKLTDLASGPRRSPGVAIARMLAVSLLSFAIVAVAATYFMDERWRESVNSGWVEVSRQLFPARSMGEEPLDIPAAPEPAEKRQRPTGQKSNVAGARNDFRGRKNRLAPFSPSLLRDFYRARFAASNNLRRRRFRIEYRVFKKEWIE